MYLQFGDSLTQYSFDPEGGWGAALAHRFQRRADVVNRGFSGYNTRIVQRELPRHVLPLVDVDTLLTTVFLGANDAAIPPAHQHVPLDEFRTNLTAIVLEIQKKNPSGKVLVITPPPIYRAGRIAFQRARDDIAADQPDPTCAPLFSRFAILQKQGCILFIRVPLTYVYLFNGNIWI